MVESRVPLGNQRPPKRSLPSRGEDLGRGKDFEEDVVIVDVDLRHLLLARELRPTIRDTRAELFEATAGKRTAKKHRRKDVR